MPFLLIDQAPIIIPTTRQGRSDCHSATEFAVKSGSARAAIKSRQAAGETVVEYTRVRVRVRVCSETHRCSRMLASKTLAAACSPSCSSRLVHAS